MAPTFTIENCERRSQNRHNKFEFYASYESYHFLTIYFLLLKLASHSRILLKWMTRSEFIFKNFQKQIVNGVHKIVNGVHNCERGRHAPNTASCSVLSASPSLLLLRKIGTLKIEQSAPNEIEIVRKSKNFRDLLSMVIDWQSLTKRRKNNC